MDLEPGSQTQPLEQDRKSKKDPKMTTQTTDNREAAPRASGLQGKASQHLRYDRGTLWDEL